MATWSGKRRFTYATIAIVAAVIIVAVPAFFLLYQAPSCTDGKKDGDELGIDCGGSCTRLCPTSFIAPSVSWTRFENIAPGIYNVAAYVVNPNPGVQAAGVPYIFTLYDDHADVIATTIGTMTIPAGRDTLAFAGSVRTGGKTPFRATFAFTAPMEWSYGNDILSSVSVLNQDYVDTSSDSSLQVTLANRSATPTGRITVYVILMDKNKNVLDFSKTVIDSIRAMGTAVAPFTWPTSHNGQVISIVTLPVAE